MRFVMRMRVCICIPGSGRVFRRRGSARSFYKSNTIRCRSRSDQGAHVTQQRFTFDEIAELYDRTRPRYPHALVDELVTLSRVPAGGRVLEIGCGTGQLTRSLAARGYRLVCLEPGLSLGALARERLASHSNVEVLTHTFESWPLESRA